VNLYFPYAQSLKDRRSILKSFAEKAEKKFHILVYDNGISDNFKTGSITLSSLGANGEDAKRKLRDSLNFLEENYPAQVSKIEEEVF
ncbi:MAG: DUF503 domain-containing protein, partial [Acidobacteria bacterium]|nr:DUF503 domain-containing protein [Acidobacteriota bacterium]